MTALRAWFTGRSLREQRLLLVMLALLVLTLLWYGIVRPVGDGLSSARARHGDAVLRLAATQEQIEAVERLAHVPAFSGAIDAAVRTSADAAGFTLSTLNQLGPERVQIGIPSARGGPLMAWLATLERQGMLVDQLQLTNNGDHTLAATITLRGRGA
jgi:general secretion pathway protein M